MPQLDQSIIQSVGPLIPRFSTPQISGLAQTGRAIAGTISLIEEFNKEKRNRDSFDLFRETRRQLQESDKDLRANITEEGKFLENADKNKNLILKRARSQAQKGGYAAEFEAKIQPAILSLDDDQLQHSLTLNGLNRGNAINKAVTDSIRLAVDSFNINQTASPFLTETTITGATETDITAIPTVKSPDKNSVEIRFKNEISASTNLGQTGKYVFEEVLNSTGDPAQAQKALTNYGNQVGQALLDKLLQENPMAFFDKGFVDDITIQVPSFLDDNGDIVFHEVRVEGDLLKSYQQQASTLMGQQNAIQNAIANEQSKLIALSQDMLELNLTNAAIESGNWHNLIEDMSNPEKIREFGLLPETAQKVRDFALTMGQKGFAGVDNTRVIGSVMADLRAGKQVPLEDVSELLGFMSLDTQKEAFRLLKDNREKADTDANKFNRLQINALEDIVGKVPGDIDATAKVLPIIALGKTAYMSRVGRLDPADPQYETKATQIMTEILLTTLAQSVVTSGGNAGILGLLDPSVLSGVTPEGFLLEGTTRGQQTFRTIEDVKADYINTPAEQRDPLQTAQAIRALSLRNFILRSRELAEQGDKTDQQQNAALVRQAQQLGERGRLPLTEFQLISDKVLLGDLLMKRKRMLRPDGN